MLFLVKCKGKEVIPLPPEETLELVVKTWETCISYKQQGIILAGGGLVSGDGCCEIWDVDSIEELDRLAAQLPIAPYCNCEFIPLTSYEHALESAKQALASVRASK